MPHLHIVFQTHWDREWYLPFESFRNRLCTVMDRVIKALENNEINQFVLDGQVAALEDYLEVCEEDSKQKLLGFIKQGRVIIGPWYVLADEFLVSGESLIRNLELGLKKAKKYGVPQKLGYLPDTFGHISQMPQLLKGFNIDNAILWRGVNPKSGEFYWKSPDGSNVLTVFLPEGYYQPIVDRPDYKELLHSYIEKLQGHSPTKMMLLTNGGDHLMPQHINLRERLDNLQVLFDGSITISEGDYETYFKEIQNTCLTTEVIEGELRCNQKAYLLPNVLSTRIYLKQQNQQIEDELTGYTEPLLTLASIETGNYPKKYVENTWELLLQNHPHDSICGCSIDEVHQEMETRTMKLSQRLSSLQEQALIKMQIFDSAMSGEGKSKPFDDYSIFSVFNPHPHPFTGWIRGVIWLSKNDSFESLVVTDSNGENCRLSVLNSWEGTYFYSPVDEFPTALPVRYYEIDFYAKDLPGVSLQSFQVSEGYNAAVRTGEDRPFIENEFLSIQLENDGTLLLYDKVNNSTHQKQQQFFSSMDAGDEYNYSPPVNDVITLGKLVGNSVRKQGQGVQILFYDIELCVPKELHISRLRGVDDKVFSRISVEISLYESDPTARVKVTIGNHAKDHRIRMKFPVGRNVEYSYSDSSFDFVKRVARKEEVFQTAKQQEVPVVVEPSYSTILVNSKDNGLFLYQRGLQEYQITSENEIDSLEVTLLRSVGWLSRDDLRTRGGGAGPHLPTPEAQCMGEYTYEYAFGFWKEGHSHGEILTNAHFFRVPPKMFRARGEEKLGLPLLQIDNRNIQWTAIRLKENNLEVRLWNPSTITESFKVRSREQIDSIKKVTIGNEQVEVLSPKQLITIKPKEIATFLMAFNFDQQKSTL